MSYRLPIRLDDETRELLEKAAELQGLNLTNFVRSAAIKEARETVKPKENK